MHSFTPHMYKYRLIGVAVTLDLFINCIFETERRTIASNHFAPRRYMSCSIVQEFTMEIQTLANLIFSCPFTLVIGVLRVCNWKESIIMTILRVYLLRAIYKLKRYDYFSSFCLNVISLSKSAIPQFI